MLLMSWTASPDQQELLTITLDAAYRPIHNQQGYTSEQHYPYPYGNKGKGRVEFGKDSGTIYFGQKSLVKTFGGDSTHLRTYRQSQHELVSMYSYEMGVGYFGDLRRFRGRSLFQPHAGDSVRTKIEDGLPYETAQHRLIDTVRWIGSLSYQPHRVYREDPIALMTSRSIGNKVYELTDHLGNVRVVVSDGKEVETSGGLLVGLLAEVESYSNYYSFGMQMPGRTYSGNKYRYGFQGQEKDDETGLINYKYRMHDPRIGRFFAVDPLASNFPWNSVYAFSENRVISAIELEGLEAVDLNTGQVDNTLSGQNLQTVQNDKNTAPWQDMAGFKVPTSQFATANLRGNAVTPQPMSRASGDEMSYDYYSVTINQLPSDMSMSDVFNHIRTNFADFKQGATLTEKFGPSKQSEQSQWNSANPLTSIMRFVVNPGFPTPLSWVREGMAVMATNYMVNENSMSWVFTPVYSDHNGDFGHPLAGHRQFGITNNGNGSYTFFTRGIDTPYGMMDNMSSKDIFAGAHQLWSNMMNNVANYVNDNGGKASTDPSSYVSFRKPRE